MLVLPEVGIPAATTCIAIITRLSSLDIVIVVAVVVVAAVVVAAVVVAADVVASFL